MKGGYIMLNVTVSNEEVLKLISDNVNELMEENKENFNKANQVMAPMSAQIAVLATLRVLQQLGLVTINEVQNQSEN